MLDIEFHDVLNAILLAGAILVGCMLVVLGFGALSDTLDAGLWTGEKIEELETTSAEGGEEEFISLGGRPLNEIVVLVGNASDGRQGLAGRATRKLDDIGYGTLDAVNAEIEPIDDSFVYYADGFIVDAIQVAARLNIGESNVRPVPADPGVTADGADIVVLLGQNADF